jgi:hypothetical protein
VAGQQAAPGIFEDGGDRQVQQLGDGTPIENILAGEPRGETV